MGEPSVSSAMKRGRPMAICAIVRGKDERECDVGSQPRRATGSCRGRGGGEDCKVNVSLFPRLISFPMN
jgi:hypothetical protein